MRQVQYWHSLCSFKPFHIGVPAFLPCNGEFLPVCHWQLSFLFWQKDYQFPCMIGLLSFWQLDPQKSSNEIFHRNHRMRSSNDSVIGGKYRTFTLLGKTCVESSWKAIQEGSSDYSMDNFCLREHAFMQTLLKMIFQNVDSQDVKGKVTTRVFDLKFYLGKFRCLIL